MFYTSAPDWRVIPPTTEENEVVKNIAELTTTLERVKVELEASEKRLFELRALRAPIFRIPDELLMDIFVMATGSRHCDRYHRLPSAQARLGLVCRRWWEVSHSCSELWTNFDINYGAAFELANSVLRSLPTSAPIALQLHYREHEIAAPSDSSKIAHDFLVRNVTRLSSLSIDIPCFTCREPILPQFNQDLPRLKSLELSQEHRTSSACVDRPIDLKRLVALRSLFMSINFVNRQDESSPILFAIPSPVLDLTLRGGHLSLSQFRGILELCPNLRQLRIDYLYMNVPENNPFSYPKLEMLNLWRMRLSNCHGRLPALAQALAQIRLPKLDSFDYSCSDHYHLHKDDDDASLIHLFDTMADARHVRLFMCKNLFRSATTALWGSGNCFPRLRYLHLDVSERGAYEVEQYPERRMPLETWFPEIEDTVMGITTLRWRLMRESSPSACLILPPVIPNSLLQRLRQEGVRAETIFRNREAWPGVW